MSLSPETEASTPPRLSIRDMLMTYSTNNDQPYTAAESIRLLAEDINTSFSAEERQQLIRHLQKPPERN